MTDKTNTPSACRAEFEAWARPDQVQNRRDESGAYTEPGMAAAWGAWQAAWDRRATPAPVAAQAPSMWSKLVPTEQAWYWHWNGDPDSAPYPLSVLWSGSANASFVSMGQLGITEAIFCEKYGGYWMKMIEPSIVATQPAPSLQEPVGEVILFGGDSDLKEVAWAKGKMPVLGTKLYAHPIAAAPEAASDSVVEANRALLLQRSQVGLKKYGLALDKSELPDSVFFQHAIEEALDFANYLQTLLMRANAPVGAAPEAASGWISVEDRLPYKATVVLAANQENIAIAYQRYHLGENVWFSDDTGEYDEERILEFAPTHWHELPDRAALALNSTKEGR